VTRRQGLAEIVSVVIVSVYISSHSLSTIPRYPQTHCESVIHDRTIERRRKTRSHETSTPVPTKQEEVFWGP
jgi:hypothetical protein